MSRALARTPLRLHLVAALALVGGVLSGCPSSEPDDKAGIDAASLGSATRIVTAAPALAEMVCALGARERLVGVSRYCVFPAELRSLPRVGGAIDPSLEAIDALAPSVVLSQSRHSGLEALAKRRPWRIEHFQVETIADVREAILRIGALVERRAEAKREVARLDAALKAARSARPARPQRVLLVAGRRQGPLAQIPAIGRGTFLDELLRAAGAVNALEQKGYPQVSAELVLERAPDRVIDLLAEPQTADARARLREDWSALSTIPAVKGAGVSTIGGDELLTPGPRLTSVLAKIRRALAGEADVE